MLLIWLAVVDVSTAVSDKVIKGCDVDVVCTE